MSDFQHKSTEINKLTTAICKKKRNFAPRKDNASTLTPQKKKKEHNHLIICMAKNQNLPDVVFETSWEVCNKVGGIYTVLSSRAKTLKERFGEENYYDICMALTSYHPEKADAVYHTIALGLREKPPRGHLLDNLANDHVNLVFKLARNASREHHHYLGFVRFEEKENGVLYARISPKCNIIMFLMPHFADRLPAENFVIYDENHGMFGVHPAREEWYLVSADESETLLQMGDTDEEKGYQDLFRY